MKAAFREPIDRRHGRADRRERARAGAPSRSAGRADRRRHLATAAVSLRSIDGYVLPLGRGPDAHRKAAGILVTNQFPQEALVHLTDAIATYPSDAGLVQARAELLARVAPAGAAVPPR